MLQAHTENWRGPHARQAPVAVRPRWIFFDLDGTLADSLPALYGAYRSFLAGQGIDGTRTEFGLLNGPAVREIVDILKEQHRLPGLTGELEREYNRLLRVAYGRQVRPVEGARAVLETFHEDGYAMAVVTSCGRGLCERFLQHAKLRGLFAFVVTGDDVEASKPDPAIYRAALDRAGAAPDDAIAVEDSPSGIRAARGAGLRVIGKCGIHETAALLAHGASATVTALRELLSLPEFSGEEF